MHGDGRGVIGVPNNDSIRDSFGDSQIRRHSRHNPKYWVGSVISVITRDLSYVASPLYDGFPK